MSQACACGSGRAHAECCGPVLDGEEPRDVEALVRARYSAAARGDARFLFRTLHPDAPARRAGRIAGTEAERTDGLTLRRLLVIDASSTLDVEGYAHALFHVVAVDGRKKRSYAEHARFARAGSAWRYVDGVRQPDRALPVAPEELTYDIFELAARR